MLVPINLTGPSSQGRAKFFSNQRTLNFYPEKSPSGFILNSFPGCKAFSTGNGPDRGAFVHKNILYQVSGTSLYTVDTSGVRTNRGAITGAERCIFDGLLDTVIITTNGSVYEWDGTTLTLATDADLETPDSCAHLNNQIIFDGDDGRWASSDVGDGISVNSLNYATAESNADDLVRVWVHNQTLYLPGDKTIEPWWNDPNATQPPFSRIEGGIIPVGLAALHSMAGNDQGFYFLGDDKNIYFVVGTAYQRVSTINIANQLENMSVVSDAQGNTFTIQGQNFYSITFPSEDRTFCFNESVGIEAGWFELSSETSEGRYLASSHVFFNGKNYVTDYRNGNIYELDINTFDEFEEEIIRIRDSAPITGIALGKPGKLLTMNRFELIMETGVGGIDNENPIVMLSFSDDGGRTWSTEEWATAGKSGDFIWKVEWFGLGSFYNRIMRVRTSDKVYWCIHSAAADIEVGL